MFLICSKNFPPATGLRLSCSLGCTLQVELNLVQGGVEILNAGLEPVLLSSHGSLRVGVQECLPSLPQSLHPLQGWD